MSITNPSGNFTFAFQDSSQCCTFSFNVSALPDRDGTGAKFASLRGTLTETKSLALTAMVGIFF
ncbi:hypothetical protein PA01_18535 [Azoarcus sp. PA01]|nr:hypothetical protein PA01_18535 [Azoarcus sp. PA01]